MLSISKLKRESSERISAENLYITAFPEIERHPVDELFDACDTDKCEWLIFKENELFVGMAYMIIQDDIAFLLYLAVEGNQRNKGYGAEILRNLSQDTKDWKSFYSSRVYRKNVTIWTFVFDARNFTCGMVFTTQNTFNPLVKVQPYMTFYPQKRIFVLIDGKISLPTTLWNLTWTQHIKYNQQKQYN